MERSARSKPASGAKTRASVAAGERPAAPPDPLTLIPSQRARRDRIVDKAFEFLMHHEYDDIQVRDIAEHAEVALGTVYRYFSSKEHLFAAVLLKWNDALRTRVQRSPLGGDTVAEQLTDLYLRVIDAFERRPQFYRTLVVIESSGDPYARTLWRTFSGESSASLAGPLSVLAPDQADAITHTVLAVLNGVLRSWVTDSITIDEARTRMCRSIELIFSPPPLPRPPPR